MADLRDDLWDDAQEEAPILKLNGHAPEGLSPLETQWLRFREQFAETMIGSFWTIEDLEAKVLGYQAFLFPGRDSAAVGTIQIYPGGARVMQVIWACGDLDELLAMEPGLSALCRSLGCSHVMVEGRRGWERALKPLGYEFWSATTIKAL